MEVTIKMEMIGRAKKGQEWGSGRIQWSWAKKSVWFHPESWRYWTWWIMTEDFEIIIVCIAWRRKYRSTRVRTAQEVNKCWNYEKSEAYSTIVGSFRFETYRHFCRSHDEGINQPLFEYEVEKRSKLAKTVMRIKTRVKIRMRKSWRIYHHRHVLNGPRIMYIYAKHPFQRFLQPWQWRDVTI